MVGALQPQGSDSRALSPHPGDGYGAPSSSQCDLASLGHPQTLLGELWGPLVLSLSPIKH